MVPDDGLRMTQRMVWRAKKHRWGKMGFRQGKLLSSPSHPSGIGIGLDVTNGGPKSPGLSFFAGLVLIFERLTGIFLIT